jgi:penicillin-binding protein 2
VFFYDLIQKLDLDAVASHAKACGVVEKTGIDLPGERSGFYPDRKYYQDKLGLTSGLNGYKANLAIGQGEVLTTPLQMNTHYAAIARGGMIIQPHLLVQTMGSGRITREQLQPLAKHQLPWSASTMQTIRDGLWAVTNAPGGTARAINVPGATSYGKTGSAQNFMGNVTHAWFCGFIETDKPDIVITVFMENAGGGGAMAAPVANKIFNYYIGNLDKIRQPAPIPAQFRTSEERLEEPPEPVEDPVPALEAEAVATTEPPQQEAGEGAR